mgnify:CR=1 FL=1
MTDERNEQEIEVEKEQAKIPTEKAGVKIAALKYIELSLADPTHGDARRDELALAVLAAPIGCARR